MVPSTRVKVLLKSRKNISEQLKVLRRFRKDIGVQEYIDSLTNDKCATEYVNYLIDRYYYNNKNAKKAKKNGLERTHKVILRVFDE